MNGTLLTDWIGYTDMLVGRCWLIELVTRTCLWRAVDWLDLLHGHACGALLTDWIGYTDKLVACYWLIELVTRTCLWRAVDWLNWLHGHNYVCGALLIDWIGYTDIIMFVARAAWPGMTIAAWVLKSAVCVLVYCLWCIFSHVFNFSEQATTAQPKQKQNQKL